MKTHISLGTRTPSRVFQTLGERTRLRIAALLASTDGRACVCELSDALNEPQYNISRHLKALQAAGLVVNARDRRWIYYRLVAMPEPLGDRLFAVLRHLPDADGQLALDRRRFRARLALRRDGQCCVWRVRKPLAGGRPRATAAST